MIVTTVTPNAFHDAFNTMRPNQFSYDALEALYYFFEEYNEDTGEAFELDVISICCDFTEYADIGEVMKDYGDIESLEDLCDHTIVIELPNEGLVIQQF